MEIGVGLDRSLGLSFEQHRELAREAARLGYTSVWTNAGLGTDPFQVCAQWSMASAEVVDGGLATGTSVVPVALWGSAPILAGSAATLSMLSGGRFMLGVGNGATYSAAYRRQFGLPELPPITLMRDWAIVLRGLLAGQTVSHAGKTLNLHEVSIGLQPPPVPLYLGALGAQMLRLGGELYDGVSLNWSTPERIAWSRERVADGARRVGRDPAEVKVIEYIRICIDDDVDLARRAYTQSLLGYALARKGANKQHGYRGMFAEMGFDEALTELETRRDRGAPESELIEAFPRELLSLVGYYGPPNGAAAAFRRLSEGLDLAIVRVVRAGLGLESALAVMQACRPDRVPA